MTRAGLTSTTYHILPYFQKMKMIIIASEEVESWLMELIDEKYRSPTTVNH
jgi:hypothetical protein